ncbi:MAG: hypothetical protein KDD33_08650 [Bdellovibrionales bacterium]|nr:hypothetical protein [Bdellovibrionales bacterium]
MGISLIKNQRGQALVESLASLPMLIVIALAVLSLPFSILSHYLSDHWVYQSSLCLAKEESKVVCEAQLLQRLRQIPFQKISEISLRRTGSKAATQITIKRFRSYRIQNELHLPLASDDFKRF